MEIRQDPQEAQKESGEEKAEEMRATLSFHFLTFYFEKITDSQEVTKTVQSKPGNGMGTIAGLQTKSHLFLL